MTRRVMDTFVYLFLFKYIKHSNGGKHDVRNNGNNKFSNISEF